MNVEIRSERPGDEPALDLVNYRAFESNNLRDGIADPTEASLVRLLRDHWPEYDRRFSFTAWDGNRPVGHALFTPVTIRLLGETIRALAVGPVAVIPDYQGQGIGGRLLVCGHELGANEGFSVAFLVGHPGYYPRYGYRQCHGFAKITIDGARLPSPNQEFIRLPVQPDDVEWLARVGAAEYADVDFGCLWPADLRAWSIPGLNALVWWTADGTRAAYTLATTATPRKWRLVLADDPHLARDVIATARPEALEQHADGWLARTAIDPSWGAAEVNASDAAMAYPLHEGALDALREELTAGRRLPGACNWPIPFALLA